MRRFSQRSHLVTLSEINITPLLDLAFVLLIIFIITTPLLTKSIDLSLPHGGRTDARITKADIRTVEVASSGYYLLEGRTTPLRQILTSLARDSQENPNLVVYIRADRNCRYDYVAQVLDGCQNAHITRFSLRTDPTPPR